MTTSVSKVKFMCSSGGKILPRPSDMKLRYVGGETRMISVGRNTAYNAFLDKMTEIYGPDIVFRYQLPEEDLDALVSVSCDEDLENMMEECDRLSLIGGSSKLRVFVFSRSDLDVTDLQDMSLDHKTSEQKFVDAVNAMAAIDITSSGMHNKFPVLAEGAIGPSYNMNDAYEVWNGVERQGRPVSLIRKNPQSDVWLAEGALPFETFHRFDDNPANHGPHPFHLLPQETIVNQQHGYIGNSVSPPDSYNNIDMYSGAVGMNDFYDLENVGAAPSSQYEPKSKFLEDLRSPLTSSLIQPQEEKLTIYHNEHNDEERRDPGISMDFGINLRDRKLLDFDDFKSSDTQLHGDQFSLSPGAFLQKQLHENHHPVAKHSKNLTFADGGEPLATIDDLKQHEVNRKALNEHDGDYEWDRFPIYDASPASDLATTDIGGTLRTQSFIETEVNSLSSPSIEKIKYDRRLQQGIGGIHQQPLATNPAMISLDEGQQPDIDSQDFPDPMTIHGENNEKFIHLQWNPKDPFLSAENYEEDSLNLNNRRVWSQVPETYSDSSSNLIPSLIHKVDDKDFLTYVDRFQSQSIPYSQQELPGKNTTHKVLESETENIKEASLSSVMDDFPALDMISNLLRSSSRADCIPARSSTEGSLGSDKTGEGETGHLKLSGKATFDDRGLKMIHDALPSKEEFDIIMSTTFVDTLNEEIPREDFSPIRDTVTPVAVPCLASTPPITSLIDTWDECEKNAVIPQHVTHEIPGEDQIDLVSDVSKETVPEEYRVELEETDEFKSFGNVSTDPVALAEAEAISRGLQIIRNSDLEELRELGSGTFGTVYHGKWRGTDVAIKRIKASCFSGREADRDRLMADFWREAYILGKLHHPNVVAFYGVVPDGPGGTLATVTEYMVNGSLKQVLQSKDRTLDRRKRLLIAMDAAFGMEYLHAKNVVHFDIKCENLLVNLRDTQRPICKVADLGLSKVKQQTFVSGGVRGTLPWMAPELLNGNSNLVSEKVDVFSFGIVMWELLTGEEPYANMHYGAIIGGIVNNKLRPTVPKWCDVGWRSLMERCWAAEPADRPNFSEVAASLRAMEASLSLNPKGLTFKQ